MSLTGAQRAAVTTVARNVIVIGSAGSRKTATLVARLANLSTFGTKLSGVAVITYTNAAAKVLTERLANLVPGPLGYCGTLHGFCLKHLQRFVYPTVELRVIDDVERDARLLRAAKEAGVGATLRQLLDYKRKTIVGPLQFGKPVHIAVMKYHTDALFEGLLDYEMILGMTAQALAVKTNERWRWNHLLVDEYQDAAPTDASIFENVAADNRFYVGDPMQAIFAFRGGDVNELWRLTARPDFEVHYLMDNWRSTPEICEAASRLAGRANPAPQRPMASLVQSGPAPRSQGFPNAAQESLSVADWLKRLVEEGESPESMAVLARTNEIADAVALMLRHVGLEIRRFAAREYPPDWTRALAALGVLARPESVPSLIRWARINDPAYNAFYSDMMASGDVMKSFAVKTSVPLTGDADKMPVELAALACSAESIALIVARFVELPDTADLGDLELDLVLNGPGRRLDGTGVFVGTIHSAKGMEFETVVMAGCEDECMPGIGKRANVEEERRLFYVGMTRAKRRLLVTWAASRPMSWGGWHSRTPSRYIGEALTGGEKGVL
jgi:DNA helicase II / ATP-dependent DNA helicase PcrA